MKNSTFASKVSVIHVQATSVMKRQYKNVTEAKIVTMVYVLETSVEKTKKKIRRKLLIRMHPILKVKV